MADIERLETFTELLVKRNKTDFSFKTPVLELYCPTESSSASGAVIYLTFKVNIDIDNCHQRMDCLSMADVKSVTTCAECVSISKIIDMKFFISRCEEEPEVPVHIPALELRACCK